MSASAPDRFWRDWNSRGGIQIPQGGLTLLGNSAVRSGQTSYNVGTGFWLGMVNGVAKFSLGNPSGNYIKWDGTTLTVSGGISVDYASITGTKPPSDADNTQTAVNATTTITGGGVTMSGGGAIKGGKSSYADTTLGFFLGYDSSTYKFNIGNSTSYLKWTGSALNIVGDITGTSSINISGTAKLEGAYTGPTGQSAAVSANEGGGSIDGVISWAGSAAGFAVHARHTGTGIASGAAVFGRTEGVGDGVYGYAPNGGYGVVGESGSASGYGVMAYNTAGGTALRVLGTSSFSTTATFSGGLVGSLTGNVTGNVTGSSGSCTGNAATATTASDVTNAGGAKLICGTYNTNMQNDGNLVVYHGATPYWDATTDLSDGKFKEAIVPTKHAGLDVINGLRVVDYKWKQDIPVTIKNKDKLKTGFIAQEVQALVPDAVNDIDGTLLLHKEELVPYLVKAVQELSEQVKAMQIEIQALKSK
jgi:hypothetical protein